MNKLITTYLFLALYVIAMLKPMFPIVDYFINYDYIAEQLCENKNKPILACYGKCYIAKEIQKSLPDSPIGENSKIPKIDFDKYPITTTSIDKYVALYCNHLQKLKFVYGRNKKVKKYIEDIFHPPQV